MTLSPAADPAHHEILVVGSCNADYLIRVPELPVPGQTVLADSLTMSCGGKGANQAVAAARLGATVRMVSAVGDDEDGAWLLRELRAEAVEVSDVEVLADAATGRAFVSVDDCGENTIAVLPGANFALSAARVFRRVMRATSRSVLVLQAEIPTTVIAAAVRAAEHVRVVLNLAPAVELDADVIRAADPLVLNESEATAFTGRSVASADDVVDALAAAPVKPRSAVVTLGAGGAVWVSAEGAGHVAAMAMTEVVDTTGAGDAFVGAMASALARGEDLEAATRLAVRAGTYSVARPGAQSSYAYRSDLEREPVR